MLLEALLSSRNYPLMLPQASEQAHRCDPLASRLIAGAVTVLMLPNVQQRTGPSSGNPFAAIGKFAQYILPFMLKLRGQRVGASFSF